TACCHTSRAARRGTWRSTSGRRTCRASCRRWRSTDRRSGPSILRHLVTEMTWHCKLSKFSMHPSIRTTAMAVIGPQIKRKCLALPLGIRSAEELGQEDFPVGQWEPEKS
ncbi:hypothetical protein B296_00053426, partial [Ensete ventricosum]